MRKRFRVLLFAALVAAFAVPVGFALSLEPAPVTATHHVSTTAVALPVLVVTAADTTLAALHPVLDAGRLLFLGSILFGLAAAVRKSV